MGEWRVVGHGPVVAALQRAVREGAAGHAYLLTGPPQVGKATVARELAKALNCTAEDPPCGACRACRRIDAGKERADRPPAARGRDGQENLPNGHPDVEWVEVGGVCDEGEHDHAGDGSKDIKICQIRRLDGLVSRGPYEGYHRVVIIDPADSLNPMAADAFLKTLEEPPPHVTFVLTAGREGRLPETIVSRCQRLALTTLPRGEIEAALTERWGADPADARRLARLADGRVGWAVRALGDPSLVERRAAALERCRDLATATREERFAYAEELAARFTPDRAAVLTTLELWETWWRDVLLTAGGCPDAAVHGEHAAALRSLADRLTPAAIAKVLRGLRDARRHLEENANARLALEVLMLDLPGTERKEEGVRG